MIYFDNAATTFPKPQKVIQEAMNAIKIYGGNPGRGGHKMAMRVSEKIYDVRKKAAEFFNSEPQNIAFAQNCTMALNTAIKGVLKENDHVIISALEHNSVLRPVHKLSLDKGVSYDIVSPDLENDDNTVLRFENKIKNNTKAIICTHASNVTGVVMPIRKLGELCRKHNLIFIVDGAQSAGILKINVKEDNIDILCLPGHKGLYGITGSGMMIVNLDKQLIDTIMEGGTGSASTEIMMPEFLPDRFEAGTVNTAGILSIGAGIDFINRISIEKIYRHEFELCDSVFQRLKLNSKVKLYNYKLEYGKNAPIISFNIGEANSDFTVSELDKFGFALRGGLHCAPLAHNFYNTLDSGTARFAPSIFSKREECEKFVKCIDFLSKNIG